MIILDHDDDSKDESNYNGRTVRHPSVAYTRDSSSILPPYEPYSYPPQSQVSLDAASATTVSVRKVRFYRNRRVWKISGIAFAVYIALTLIIALPILVHVSVFTCIWRRSFFIIVGRRYLHRRQLRIQHRVLIILPIRKYLFSRSSDRQHVHDAALWCRV